MNGVARGAVPLIVLAVVVTGCSSETTRTGSRSGSGSGSGYGSDTGAGSGADDDWDRAVKKLKDEQEAASEEAEESGRKRDVGPGDSACILPVAFDPGRYWHAKAVEGAAGKPLRKEFSLVCEVNSKEAHVRGTLRVWTAATAGRSAEQALKSLVGDVAPRLKHARYSSVRTGDLPVAEVVFTETPSPGGDQDTTARAFAIRAPDGITVVQLGGLGGSEDPAALPAYERAKKSAGPRTH
ncbi:lipoprotein [Streptomyces sp. NPDC000594]|uniref:lipoprotein n=1 Tax=Streptomyces sp. NPDC000594 TaxID=3154261 RepID=UPI00331EBA1C